MNLEEKINRAVKLLQVFAKGEVVEVCFSGGKGSEVILELAMKIWGDDAEMLAIAKEVINEKKEQR